MTGTIGRAGLFSTLEAATHVWPDADRIAHRPGPEHLEGSQLWNQQGSHVLRGNIIALPVSGGFLYVESIYIQATEARMPQLKKVVLAMGDRLIYRDTFNDALAELTGSSAPGTTLPAATPATAPVSAATDENVPALAERLSHLRDQAEQLTRELDSLEKETQKKK